MRKKRWEGFTLIELLVVLSIIAIISATVVALSSGLTTKSAIAMTYATEKQLTSQFNQYIRGHDGAMPNGFDSLMREDWATVSPVFSPVFTTNALGQILLTSRNTAPRGYIYAGYDLDQNGYADTNFTSKGVTVMACQQGVQSLTVAKLRASDVTALNQLGITYVYDISHSNDMDAAGTLTYVKRTLQVGDPVMVLDPGSSGQPTYSSINGSSSVNNLYIVFGIGSKCTMIGDRRGGLQEAPVCSTIVTSTSDKPKPRADYYNRYMVAIKMPLDSLDKPAFAGILDSQGWSSQGGQQWYARFPE